MGGVNMPEGGGKRTLDFDLNLVPFIDLLSCCISFLLITAVWTQMGKLDTTQKLDGGAGGADKPKKVSITIAQSGYELMLPEAEGACTIGRQGSKYDAVELKKILEKEKNTVTGQLYIGIAAVDELPFELLVDVMDICSGLGLKNVSLGQLVAPPQGGPRCGGG
ncbi:MAG: biopolymer transporter ExbD [Deltaproteobacteria bacterium]|jgi:biopolymer transport protein ExbD|nr:biopolymer transporter ExbD [Deltaproteobacteria bacterium]